MKKSKKFVEGMMEILVKHGVVDAKEGLALSLSFKDSSQEEFDDFLVEEGLVDDVNVLRALSEYYQVPAFDVVGYFFDYSLLHKFPKDFLLRNGIIPLEQDENILAVVASDPSNPELLASIGKHVSYDIQFRVGLRRDISDAIKEYYDKALTEDVDAELDFDAQQRAIDQARNRTVRRFMEVHDEEPVEDTKDEL